MQEHHHPHAIKLLCRTFFPVKAMLEASYRDESDTYVGAIETQDK